MDELIIEGRRIGYGCSRSNFDASQTTLLFIHGSGGDREDWRFQLDGLTAPGAVMAIELPGHGKSDPPGEQSISGYARWVELFVTNLGLKRVVLMGCSLGSAITQWMALHPQSWLVAAGLIGSGARLRVLPSLLDGLINEPSKALQSLASHCLSSSCADSLRRSIEEKYGNSDPMIIHGDLSACDQFDVMDTVHRVSVPTLIVVGQEDQLTPVKYSRFLAEKIERSNLVIIPGAGHLVMLERPNEFNEATQKFLNSL
ncbi:MAG: alpha/beta hydrolase [Deltaproteobacteria bacterium]|nr:alpha/beta hydrolase [Deltaproteobacteria bacterium]